MQTLLIGVSGKIGAGKTTFCNLLKTELEKHNVKVEFRNFADRLKKICYDLTGYYGYTQEEKNIYLPEFGMTVGEALQKIGTDGLRDNFHKLVWVISALRDLEQDTLYLIGDCRFPNEAIGIKEKGGIVIRLNGDPAGVRANSQRDLYHLSETALDEYNEFDEVYENEGSQEDLQQFVNKVVSKYVVSTN